MTYTEMKKKFLVGLKASAQFSEQCWASISPTWFWVVSFTTIQQEPFQSFPVAEFNNAVELCQSGLETTRLDLFEALLYYLPSSLPRLFEDG